MVAWEKSKAKEWLDNNRFYSPAICILMFRAASSQQTWEVCVEIILMQRLTDDSDFVVDIPQFELIVPYRLN